MRMILAGAALLAAAGSTSGQTIAEQAERCWSPPSNVGEVIKQGVVIDLEIDRSGELVSIPSSPQSGSGDVPTRITVEAAVRAIRRCAPYVAPAGNYRIRFPEPGETRAEL